MRKLPQDYLNRMERQMGGQFGAFLASCDSQGYSGLRVNTGKIAAEEFCSRVPFQLSPVPWTKNGFYYDKEEPVTKHPYYYAGLYYIQEPSAMLPASRLPVQPGDIVLDLCAAPGGKATELSSLLQGSGLLVANDASASRAKALVKNLALWGAPNCCITGDTPQRLLEQFGCCFDKILVDAPCSGEGMFRRDSGLIDAWKERGPEYYAPLQKEILDCAVQMLKPGGMLAYSTCTFSQEENEEVVSELLSRYPELEMVQPELAGGFAPGSAPCEKSIRIWPHRVKGEGHFFALLGKRGPEEPRQEISGHVPCPAETVSDRASMAKYSSSQIRQDHSRIPEQIMDFLTLIPEHIWENTVYGQIGEQCFLLPPYHLPKRLRYLRTGIMLGTLKKGRFEPGQALAMLLREKDFPCVLNLPQSDGRTVRYLKGETLELTRDEEEKLSQSMKRMVPGVKGWTLICVDGFALGWGKYVEDTVRNKYYPGWRLQ